MDRRETESAADLLAHQRLSLEPIDLAEAMRPPSEEAGYRLQSEANRRLATRGLGAPAGHKIGCTTPVMQAFLGIHAPCAGEIFAATVIRGNGTVRRSAYRKLGVECEIAVELARDIAPGATLNRESAAEAVGAIMTGIEIVDDRYRDYRTFGVPSLIADNFFNAGCVLGAPLLDWRRLDLQAIAGRTLINGSEVGRGNGAMVLGHPLDALVWLVNSRAKRSLGLRRGEFVFLGSLVETKWVNAGDRVRIEIDALGALELAIAE